MNLNTQDTISHQQIRKSKRARNEYADGTKANCQVCGKDFNRKTNTANRACSRECGFKLASIDGMKTRRVTKEQYGIRKLKANQNTKAYRGYVSEAGRNLKLKTVCLVKDKPRPTNHCSYCYKEIQYIFGRTKSYCDKTCASNALKHKAICDPEWRYIKRFSIKRYRKENGIIQTSRGRARSAGVYYEPVKNKEILSRSNWKCAACGIDTPKRLRGTFKDNAPEIDHIIPLAKGGPHTSWNLQVLCRSCNISKSDMYNNQFILTNLIEVST